MTTEIKPVKMYPCPETGKLFRSKNLALKSAEKERERKRLAEAALVESKKSEEIKQKQRDYIRLNLANTADLEKMLIEKAKEFFNIDVSELKITVNFGQVSNSHGCPLNGVENWSGQHKDRPTSYLGWSGKIEAKVIVNNRIKERYSTSATDYLFNRWGMGFAGFHTGCGLPGGISNNSSKMDIGFYFFLDDFPLLKQKYDKYLIEREKEKNNELIKKTRDEASFDFANNQKKYQDLLKKINKLEKDRVILHTQLRTNYIARNPLILTELSDDYQNLKNNFSSR